MKKDFNQEYKLVLENGTQAIMKVNISVTDYSKADFGKLMSQIASTSRQAYLTIAKELKECSE
ncbi:hypothetical protein [Anaerosporobacter mobilis]|uniref:hypothetical protein n=1 Tax=Anaerosporobacter mobilis TaxID=264463 RepID=UPI0011149B26|nr:hypothetical protein [Anaerosporobacter mobilis]